jgi:hypothetical protein
MNPGRSYPDRGITVEYCECGHAAHAHPYQLGPGMTWTDPCLDPECQCGSYDPALGCNYHGGDGLSVVCTCEPRP